MCVCVCRGASEGVSYDDGDGGRCRMTRMRGTPYFDPINWTKRAAARENLPVSSRERASAITVFSRPPSGHYRIISLDIDIAIASASSLATRRNARISNGEAVSSQSARKRYSSAGQVLGADLRHL